MEIKPVGLYDATQEVEALYAALLDTQAELARLRAENERLRGVLLSMLYQWQGGYGDIGQRIRKALGIGQFARLTPEQITQAKAALAALDQERG